MGLISYMLRRARNLIVKTQEKLRYKKLEKKASLLYDAFMEGGGNIVILSSDCVGGRIMNDFRMPVNTPTVNNWYSSKDFLKICENPQKYFTEDLIIDGFDENGGCRGYIDDVIVHFGHDKDPNQASKKWKRGCKQYFRAIKKKYEVVVIMNDRNGFQDEDISRFESLPYTYKVLYTHKKHINAPHTLYMAGEDNLPYVDMMTNFESMFTLKRRYDRYDYYKTFMDIYSCFKESGLK